MKPKLRNALLAAVIVPALCALLAWSGGYNFDHRDEKVSDCVFYTMLLACLIGVMVWAFTEDSP